MYTSLLNSAFSFDEMDLLVNGVNQLVKIDSVYLTEEELNPDNARLNFSSNLVPVIDVSKDEIVVDLNKDTIDMSRYIKSKSRVDKSKASIQIVGEVKGNELGDYEIQITSVDEYGYTDSIIKRISVIDNLKPVIKFSNM